MSEKVLRDPELLEALLCASEQEVALLRTPAAIGLERSILLYEKRAHEKALCIAAAEIARANGVSLLSCLRRLLKEAGYAKCADCGMIIPLEASSQVDVPGVVSPDRLCGFCTKL